MAFLKDKEAAAYQKTHRKHTEQQNKLPNLCHEHQLKRSVEAESVEEQHQLTEFWQASLHKGDLCYIQRVGNFPNVTYSLLRLPNFNDWVSH